MVVNTWHSINLLGEDDDEDDVDDEEGSSGDDDDEGVEGEGMLTQISLSIFHFPIKSDRNDSQTMK